MATYLSRASGLLCFLLLLGLFVPPSQGQNPPLAAPSPEYENLPLDGHTLSSVIRKSRLVLVGQIVAYSAGRDSEKEEIEVSEVLKGHVDVGTRVAFFCVCHTEGTADPSAFLGHRVIVFLKEGGSPVPWQPASPDFQYFYHPDFHARVVRAVRANGTTHSKP